MAWKPLGWEAAWFSEIEPFANAVLAHRYPDVPNLGDMKRIHDNETFKKEEIDILVGGTPCQSFSSMGKHRGLRDPRGRLALAYAEIVRRKRPRWIVWENVPGVLSSGGGRDFGAFLGPLAECGYSLAYRVLDAQYYGVPQHRQRVFVVGHLGGAGEGRVEQVLFDSEGGPWNAPPRRTHAEVPLEVALECRPENFGWETSSGEASNCLLTSGRRSFLIDSDELDGYIDPNVGEIKYGDPRDGDPMIVRSIMPVEYERLQGFPDDYTQIFYRHKPAEKCPDGPRYEALGNSICTPVLRWIGERIAAFEGLACTNVVQHPDPETVAKALSDSELVQKCMQGFRSLREIAPYLREARDRFAQPGRRVPVPGNPTWTEWVETNLNVTVRRVQQLLSEGTKPREIISPSSKQRKLRTGDWRGLLKATERRNAHVFGSVEDPKQLAGAIRNFAQGIADRYSKPGGKLVVSVSVK